MRQYAATLDSVVASWHGQVFSEFPARLAVLIEQGLSPLPFWITAVAAPCRTSNALRSSNGSGAIREKEIPRIVVPNWLE